MPGLGRIPGNGNSGARLAAMNRASRIFWILGQTQTALTRAVLAAVQGKDPPVEGDSSGCNWAAYGFFGTMGKGRIVIADDGEEVEVFSFAEEEGEENGRKNVQETE